MSFSAVQPRLDEKTAGLIARYRRAVDYLASARPSTAARAEELVREAEGRLRGRRALIREHGADPPEITDWRWRGAA